ncbi:MAG TPA: GDSL-type esterase/lipase family protein [Candidatus Marinimicrobia bacterium]|nr:GDSL-type esterase/lipase family protein [Candidatus Neomarinimicrobiota bacterium]
MERIPLKKIAYMAILLSLITQLLYSQENVIRIACVGNSITEGNAMATKTLDAYPVALGRYLGAGYEVKNCGVSGTTLLKKGDYPIWNEKLFAEALNFNPNIVTIMLGTNDSKPYNWIYKGEFISDYLAMIDTFRQLSSRPEIYICLPLPAFSGAWDIRDSIIVNDIIPMISQVADSANVNLIDLHTPFLDKSSLMPDGIHPLIEGSDLIARILMEELTGRRIESQTENDVALCKLAIQSGTNVPELTDGNSNTYAVFSSTSTPVTINLGDEVKVDLVQINFTNISISEFAFTFAASIDSLDWTTLIDTTLLSASLLKCDSTALFSKTFQPIPARFLKFQIKENGIPDDSGLLINQINIFERRVVHAPIWGWELVSTSDKYMRVKVRTQKTSNIGEYIKIYKQSKADGQFELYANYGSDKPLEMTSFISYGSLNRYYSVVFYNDVEIASDTMTIIARSASDIKNNPKQVLLTNYNLFQNFPNPFNSATNIGFYLAELGEVNIEIIDLNGRLIRSLSPRIFSSGINQIRWDGCNQNGIPSASGIYFYRLKIGDKPSLLKKMVLLR